MTKDELLRIAKPILFNQEMTMAIDDGRKGETRRLIKHPVERATLNGIYSGPGGWSSVWTERTIDPIYCFPPYRHGDLLYVRETWAFWPCIVCNAQGACGKAPMVYEDRESVSEGCWIYRAAVDPLFARRVTWHPSIHMPKEAARLFLRVTSVTPQRLQDITGADCVAEGIPAESLAEMGEEFTRGQFADLWDSTVSPDKLAVSGWDANPWVWVIKFERIHTEEK